MSTKTIFGILILATLIPATSYAGDITLKRSFFGNWKFATGDSNYVTVGPNCEILRREMAHDSVAVAEIDKYNDQISVSTVGYLCSFGVAAVPIYKVVKDEWESDYWTVAGVAAGLFVVSTLLERSANNHLRNGVNNYNRRAGSGSAPPTVSVYPTVFYKRMFGVGLTIQF